MCSNHSLKKRFGFDTDFLDRLQRFFMLGQNQHSLLQDSGFLSKFGVLPAATKRQSGSRFMPATFALIRSCIRGKSCLSASFNVSTLINIQLIELVLLAT